MQHLNEIQTERAVPKSTISRLNRVLLVMCSASLLVLLACSGGSNTSPAPANRIPVASPGSNQTVKKRSQVTLDGSGSKDADGDALSYAWTQTAGTAVVMTGSTTAKPTFTSPGISGVIKFTLVVSDGKATSSPVEVSITVTNDAPISVPGPNRTIQANQTFTLDGTGSSDPDGDSLTYSWVQTQGTAVVLQATTPGRATFTAPSTDGLLAFSLTVNDGEVSSQPSIVTIQVQTVINLAPVISRVELSPAGPKRNDPIEATVVAYDPNGDVLATSYVWKRNGALVPSATGANYPLGNQAKNDVISVEVTVSDGVLAATGGANVTIQNTPALLSATPPTTATIGVPVSFQISATDDDGDPIGPMEVDFGPAGFTVNGAGLASWTPSGPTMDRQVGMAWGVRISTDSSAKLGGTILVTDPIRQYPIVRTNVGVPIGSNNIEIEVFDTGTSKSALIGSNTGLYLLAKDGAGYVQTWAYPYNPGMGEGIGGVSSGDIDGDGRREIFFISGTTVLKLDGLSRREMARYGQDVAALNGPTAPLIWKGIKCADIDQDGVKELICLGLQSDFGSTGYLYVLNAATFELKWKTDALVLGSSLAVGNVDGDSALEIVTSAGFVFDGITHLNEWAYGAGFGFTVDLGDLDGDGVSEIVGAVDWTAVRIYSAVLKSPLWEIPTSDLDSIRVADLDGSAPAEIVVGDGQWGNVSVYRYNTVTKSMDRLSQINSQDHGVSGIAAGDMDGDGALDLVWGTGLSSSGKDSMVVAAWNATTSVKWKGPVPQLDGPFTGAKLATLAPGEKRLVFLSPRSDSGYAGTRILALDPVTGRLSQSNEVDTNWSRIAACDVGDVLGTGIDQILLGSASLYDDYFTAYDFATNTKKWQSGMVEEAMAITHADLSGDNVADLVGITSARIYAWDVRNQALLWSSTGLNGGKDVAIADLDGAGKPEIVALANDRVVVYGYSSTTNAYLERASYVLTTSLDLLVADVDGDGAPEIFVLGTTSANSSLSVLRFNTQLQLQGAFLAPNAKSLFLEESAHPRKNLLVGFESLSWSTPKTPARLSSLDPKQGIEIWRSEPILGGIPINSLSFVDILGDGKKEITFGTSQGMYLTH